MATLHNEKAHILFVEDDEYALELITFQLPEYRFTLAHNFGEGLTQAQQRYFDLYILDNWLPDGSGVELCQLIREFDPHTPVLFYSAAAYERDVQNGLRAGAQMYLTKPASSAELNDAVVRLISDAGKMAFDARQAEYAAIREELVIRQVENVHSQTAAKGKLLRAEDRATKVKARIAYLAAGGTRGDFARHWTSLSSGDVRRNRNGKRRMSD